MWATPSRVDLAALCEAHRIPFASVSQHAGLLPALQSAWDRKAASVVEVVTDRHSNVSVHRQIQAACTEAARRALHCLPPLPPATQLATAHAQTDTSCNGSHTSSKSNGTGRRRLSPAVQHLEVRAVEVSQYSLPLAAPVTTGAPSTQRHGTLVCLSLAGKSDQAAYTHEQSFKGTGDVAPLPGLHHESISDARAQLAALSELLPGCSVPQEVALLGGNLHKWWQDTVGVSPNTLLPSVRFAVECAVFEALAQSHQRTFAQHLLACAARGSHERGSGMANGVMQPSSNGAGMPAAEALGGPYSGGAAVRANALLDPGKLSLEEVADKAREFVAQGYDCIKVKVRTVGMVIGSMRTATAHPKSIGSHVSFVLEV